MDREEFQRRMPIIDSELADKDVPVHLRAFDAFNILAPKYNGLLFGQELAGVFGELEGPNLLQEVNNWYIKLYGGRFNLPTDRGKFPVLIKREIYLIRVPLAYGSMLIQILPLINELTSTMAESLSNDELDAIQKSFHEGFGLTYEFEDLMQQLDVEASNGEPRKNNPFLISADRDRTTAADCLEGIIDTNAAVFHSQQLAEKMLKAVIYNFKEISEENIRKKYSHRLSHLYDDVVSFSSTTALVDASIDNLSKYKMDIRYSSAAISKAEAVAAFWSGLRVGGWCATVLSGLQRRVN